MFDIKGKVALITGGAGGVGLELSKALLRNNLRGVALVDLNASLGEKAVLQIQSEFGQDKAIFFKADVTNIEQLEDAFKKTVEHYHYLDIVFNNAGILNDAIWEKEISINVVRVVAMCPGVTHTPLISEIDGKSLGGIYEDCKSEVATWPTQDPDVLARQAMEVVKYAPHGSIWVIEGGEPAYQYIHPDKSSMKHNVISRYYN
ncbi:15-hydroxyprostaglandin dehydrogenase [NAD(+)] isoform X2 [Diabrotica virgifera virgifera]|uniref:15-hydroxyprostaglandin dehydrogenase [NAD(+)]-like n=1 Tax=Diabrotica virgifera virgifera TaxID=50390 RepID=A0ABM5IJT4_DIAVI|nr:15-hydroxyprostaglandin dehydrogenase [NAD(+)] isoform X2 [Diabrotica virgifera virgifera]